MELKKKPAISILEVRKILGKEEFSKKTVKNWVDWLSHLELLADCIVEEMVDSKYQSSIDKVERIDDN